MATETQTESQELIAGNSVSITVDSEQDELISFFEELKFPEDAITDYMDKLQQHGFDGYQKLANVKDQIDEECLKDIGIDKIYHQMMLVPAIKNMPREKQEIPEFKEPDLSLFEEYMDKFQQHGFETYEQLLSVSTGITRQRLSQMGIDKIADQLVILAALKGVSIKSTDHLMTASVSLSRDIYMAWMVLMAYGRWGEMSRSDRRNFRLMVYGTMLIQFGTLFLLSTEMINNPPWDSYEGSVSSFDFVIVVLTKICALIAAAVFISRERMNIYLFWLVRQKVPYFNQRRIHFIAEIFWCFNFCLMMMAGVLSVGLISTAETGFDAILNAVGITFILEIDNWMYDFISSHKYVEDSLFEQEYQVEKGQEISPIAQKMNKWQSVPTNNAFLYHGKLVPILGPILTCFHDKYSGSLRQPDVSSRCSNFVMVLLIGISTMLIFMGQYYDIKVMGPIGIVLLSLMSIPIVLYCIVLCFCFGCVRCCLLSKIEDETREFMENKVPEIYKKYKDQFAEAMASENETKQNRIIGEFMEECQLYALENHIAIWHSTQHRLSSYLDDHLEKQ